MNVESYVNGYFAGIRAVKAMLESMARDNPDAKMTFAEMAEIVLFASEKMEGKQAELVELFGSFTEAEK